MISTPLPRANPALFGHTEAQRILRFAADQERLHHAWLLTGAEGIGKATLGFRFARALLAQFPGPGLHVAPTHPVFRQVAAGTHPDLVTLPRTSDDRKQLTPEISVEEARSLLQLFAVTPAAGGWRICIIERVESLNKNAANALLKLLEEPPDQAIFVLTSALPNRIARTIRSRCACLHLRPLDEHELSSALRHLLAGIDGPLPLELAGLSPGEAIRRMNSEPDGSYTGHLRDVQSRLHSELVASARRDEEVVGREVDASIEQLCEDLGALWRLSAATAQFNLDRQQLSIETDRLAAR